MTRVEENIVAPLLAWFAKSARRMPWREARDPYAIWVSEIMLQQTQVATVIPYWERWMSRFPSITSLAEAPIDDVLKQWEGLGYYSRARNLQKAAQLLVEQFDGKFPEQLQDIESLPGIGPYTAGAVASIAFDQPAPIVDGNVTRVITRLLAIEKPARSKEVRDILWRTAAEWVGIAKASGEAGTCSNFNQSLMELGALVCLPGSPRCEACPLEDSCQAARRGVVSRIPDLGERPKMIAEARTAWVITRMGRTILRRRADGLENAGFWEFPNDLGTTVAAAPSHWSLILPPASRKTTVKHSIMNRRITLVVSQHDVSEALFTVLMARIEGAEGVPWDRLAHLPLTAAHRKALKRLAA